MQDIVTEALKVKEIVPIGSNHKHGLQKKNNTINIFKKRKVQQLQLTHHSHLFRKHHLESIVNVHYV